MKQSEKKMIADTPLSNVLDDDIDDDDDDNINIKETITLLKASITTGHHSL